MSFIDTVKAELGATKVQFGGVHFLPGGEGEVRMQLELVLKVPQEIEVPLEKLLSFFGALNS